MEYRGAPAGASRPSPLRLVSDAVAGDSLQGVAESAAHALGRPVAIALPAFGPPVLWPAGAVSADAVGSLAEHAKALVTGDPRRAEKAFAATAPVRIADELVGVVSVLAEPGHADLGPDERVWLEAAAAAAAVVALLRDTQGGDARAARRELIAALTAARDEELTPLLAEARRHGLELRAGAVAICAQSDAPGLEDLPEFGGALLADIGGGRLLGLVGAAGEIELGAEARAIAVCEQLAARGMRTARSAPRRAPAALPEALREAELLLELGAAPDCQPGGQEETYRLLIGVLIRDPEELEQLRRRTIAALAEYDAEHDTELMATLRAFLAHDGSTTETAEVMQLHRHTVGYRLSRVHEVSGLSPYESDGRERLSLGLKADQIIRAENRRARRE
jgi:hypothetical protein